ncbi:MAG TPA: hypothetical protein IAB34_10435, partial [Candidatus Egerieimonas faecigallinarum]|nr:hypothetical protein [Candidatus Egerieimonas faecigallinarum]
MRRHIGLIIAAVFLGSLAGCGGQEQSNTVRYDLRELDVTDLRMGQTFQLETIPWKSDPSEAMKRIGTLERYPQQAEEDQEVYSALERLTILGEEAEVLLTYEQGILKEAELNLDPGNAEETEAYTQKLLEELNSFCGDGIQSTTDGVNTTLWQSAYGGTYLQVEEEADEERTTLRLWWEAEDGSDEVTVSLKNLNDGSAYRYAVIPWDASVEEVEASLGEALDKIPQVTKQETDTYKLPETRTLEEIKEQVEIQFQFRQNMLKKVAFVYRGEVGKV